MEDRKKELEEMKCNRQEDNPEPPPKRSRKLGVRDVGLHSRFDGKLVAE